MKSILCNKSRITLCALAVFTLMLFPWRFAGISFRTWLVYLYTLCVGLFWIYDGKKRLQDGGGKQEKKKRTLRKWNLLDSLLAAFLAGNIMLAVRDSLGGAGVDENTLLMIALVVLFFLLSGKKAAVQEEAAEPVIYRYRDVFLGCGFVVCLGLLWHFLLDKAFKAPIMLLLENEQALTSFLLFLVTLAAEGYYKETGKGKKYFYILSALAGFFLLFLQKSIMGILLGGIGFLVSALVHKPEREQIKRISLLAFAYFFLLSNMSLLQYLIPALKENGGYNMEGSIWLELGLAAFCIVALAWWEKQPEEERYLLQYKRWILKIAIAVCIVFFSLLVSGSRLADMEGKGAAILCALFVKQQTYMSAHDNVFAAVLGKYGIPGVFWMLAVWFVASKKVWERSKRGKLPPALTVLFIMWLLQSFFMAGQAVAAPVQVMFMAEILYGECMLPIQAKKQKTEKAEEEKGLKRKRKIRGILFCLIASITCFLTADMKAFAGGLSSGVSQEDSPSGAQEEPVTGVPIESTTLMYAVEKVNVRKGPGTDAEIIGELGQGEMVFAVELLAEGWYRVVFGGETGYVRQDFLALYGTPGAWEAPEQPQEIITSGQNDTVAGKRAAGAGNADDGGGQEEKTPRAAKQAKSKGKNASTIVIIAAAVLLILGYSVFQVIKEKQENEKGNDEGDGNGQEPEDEAMDEDEASSEWVDGEEAEWETEADMAAESREWKDGEDFAATGGEEEDGAPEVLEEDEMVILDIDEV